MLPPEPDEPVPPDEPEGPVPPVEPEVPVPDVPVSDEPVPPVVPEVPAAPPLVDVPLGDVARRACFFFFLWWRLVVVVVVSLDVPAPPVIEPDVPVSPVVPPVSPPVVAPEEPVPPVEDDPVPLDEPGLVDEPLDPVPVVLPLDWAYATPNPSAASVPARNIDSLQLMPASPRTAARAECARAAACGASRGRRVVARPRNPAGPIPRHPARGWTISCALGDGPQAPDTTRGRPRLLRGPEARRAVGGRAASRDQPRRPNDAPSASRSEPKAIRGGRADRRATRLDVDPVYAAALPTMASATGSPRCSHARCKLLARWRPVLNVPIRREGGGQLVRIDLPIVVCSLHKLPHRWSGAADERIARALRRQGVTDARLDRAWVEHHELV